DGVFLLLEGYEPEGLVLDEWPTEREAIVLVAQGRLAGRQSFCRECARVEEVKGAVKLVAAGLQNNVHDAASIASALGVGIRLRSELVDCIERHNDAGDAGDAALVDGRDVV